MIKIATVWLFSNLDYDLIKMQAAFFTKIKVCIPGDFTILRWPSGMA